MLVAVYRVGLANVYLANEKTHTQLNGAYRNRRIGDDFEFFLQFHRIYGRKSESNTPSK